MAKVTIRYWAAAAEAAGTKEEPVHAETLAEALNTARRKRGGDSHFEKVLARSSFLIDSAPAGRRDHESIGLPEGVVIEVLPPFAGG
jgi:molybdopterin converting factor small subunit